VEAFKLGLHPTVAPNPAAVQAVLYTPAHEKADPKGPIGGGLPGRLRVTGKPQSGGME
jgi:hypothetical protein